ncbi:protease modulator HflC [Desulfobacter curvatus]|uniref:protease modulator HflC n=1 Tax=Desulfobacter curvatus TaxID=2290 RepID=UPI000367A582|nr:protease modulator HflC [Desulfobacter curvatus]
MKISVISQIFRLRIAIICIGLPVALVGYFSLFTVAENELVILTRFGRPVRIIENAGLQIKLPGFFENVNRFNKRSDLFETQPTQLLLGDKKPIIISCYVLWKIYDPLLFFQAMGQASNAVLKLGDIVNSKLSIVLADYTIDNIINTNAENVLLDKIEEQITETANKNSIKKYGIKIQRTGVQRLAYPSVVINSVYERMRSERIKEADKIKAEGYEAAEKISIEAEKQAREIKAKAQKEALILKGEGDKQSMEIYTKAYQEGGEFFNFLQSLETYSTILGKDTTLILSTDSELFKYLQLDAKEALGNN